VRRPDGAWVCRRCASESSKRSAERRKQRDPEAFRSKTREKVARHRANKPKLTRAKKKERETRLSELGLREPRCRDGCGAKVSALGRSCRPCAMLRAKKDGVSTTSNKIKETTPSHVKGRENAEREARTAKPFAEQLVARSAATVVIGRDRRVFELLCADLGVTPARIDGNGEPCYLGADLIRIRDELRNRAAQWREGTRARAY
jgi:hypothetical protein